MLTARSRLAMTLVEVLVGLVIVALLAAVLYPAVAVQLQRGQSAALANQLGNLREAAANYRQNVQRYPRTLSQLTNALTAAATDACAGGVPVPNRNMWRGPYLTQNVSGDMPVGDATVKDTLVRVPPNTAGGPVGTLQIHAINVDNSTAVALEDQFDGNNNLGAGTIVWTPTSGTLGDLIFQIPIRGC